MTSKPYFDKVAGQWDAMRQSFFSEAVREKAYAVAGVEPGRVAADIGASTGFVTEGLLELGLRVIAIDQSASMLEILRSKFKETGGARPVSRTAHRESVTPSDHGARHDSHVSDQPGLQAHDGLGAPPGGGAPAPADRGLGGDRAPRVGCPGGSGGASARPQDPGALRGSPAAAPE